MRLMPQGRRPRLVLAVVMMLAGLGLALATDLTGTWGALLWVVAWGLSAGGVLTVVDMQRQRRREGLGDVLDWSAPDAAGVEPTDDGQTIR